jgi:thymidylate synthase
MLTYDQWYEKYEDEISIEFAETGADRECDFDPDLLLEDRYDEYLKNYQKNIILHPQFFKATSISDAWHQCVYRLIDSGRIFDIDRGSFEGQKRLEFDFITVHLTHPSTIPLLPKVNPSFNFPDPVEEGYLDDYLPYLMTGEEKVGESYTYGQRICKAKLHDFMYVNPELQLDFKKLPKKCIMDHTNGGDFEPHVFINQMELMIWTYKNKGVRNNQMTLQVGQPSDMLLKDPPCLRHIDTRIQDGKLHFFPYFRSWDLFGGFPANLAAIEMMKQYCAAEIGVENGEIIATSKGLHIYDYVFEIAETLRGKTLDEFKNF